MSKLKVIIGQPATGSGGGAVDSVNGETGIVVLYGTDIDTTSTSNQTITQKLNELDSEIDSKVDSVFGRSGNVIAESGDYDTEEIANNDTDYFPSDANQYDINRNFKVNIDANTSGISANAIEIINLDGSKVSSLTDNEPTGSDVIFNVVSLTQAEYDAGTPIATTFYLITDA